MARALYLHARLRPAHRELEIELTQRQRAEAELQAIRDDLENRVHERTHALEARNEELSRVRLALETANQRLRRLVAVDPLTGIANRRHFDRVLDREVRRARREQLPLSLIFLDLDEFKHFNDTYGHAHGDEVLAPGRATLDESFRRGGDLVARYGGEEFAVVLPGVGAHRAGLYAERLRRRIWRMAISEPTSGSNPAGERRITISGGVAAITPGCARLPTIQRRMHCYGWPTRRSTRPNAGGAIESPWPAGRPCTSIDRASTRQPSPSTNRPRFLTFLALRRLAHCRRIVDRRIHPR